jgi:hypothetical protein
MRSGSAAQQLTEQYFAVGLLTRCPQPMRRQRRCFSVASSIGAEVVDMCGARV